MVPKPQGCNVWAEPPSRDYLCDSRYCQPAPDFVPVVWPENQTSYYPPVEGYFDLNPNAFGLSHDIFAKTEIVIKKHGKKKTITTGNWVSQTDLTHFPPEPTSTITSVGSYGRSLRLSKRDDTITPAVCYNVCNDAFRASQEVGLVPELCEDDSPFLSYTEQCKGCIALHSDGVKKTPREYVDDQFAETWDFCDIRSPDPQQSSTDRPPASQVTQLPPISSVSQAPPNTETEPIPITTSSVDEPEPTPSSSEPEATPTVTPTPTSAPTTPPTSTADDEPEPTGSETETGTPPGETSESESAGPSSTGDGGGGETTPTGTLTFQTSTTGQPATSSFATAAAGRLVPGGRAGLGSALAGLVAALFFL
jgi:hypothetical protein